MHIQANPTLTPNLPLLSGNTWEEGTKAQEGRKGIGHLREVHWTIPRVLTEALSNMVQLQSLRFPVIQRRTGNLSLNRGYVSEV